MRVAALDSAIGVHVQTMEFGAAQGWWPEYNERGPLDWPRKVSLSKLPARATMAHALVAAGFFQSISQARKNGWDKPISRGISIVDKQQHRIEIID